MTLCYYGISSHLTTIIISEHGEIMLSISKHGEAVDKKFAYLVTNHFSSFIIKRFIIIIYYSSSFGTLSMISACSEM